MNDAYTVLKSPRKTDQSSGHVKSGDDRRVHEATPPVSPDRRSFASAQVSGLVISEDDQSLTIVEPSGKSRTIPNDDIESVKPLQKSVMPDLMLAEFTA